MRGNFILQKGNEAVASFELESHSMCFFTYEVKILNKDLLPPILKYLIEKKDIKGASLDYLFYTWLLFRMVPSNRYGLDELMLSYYQLQPHRFGRMSGTQHTAAILNYYSSWFDDYIVTLVTTQNLCYVLEDQRFMTLFTLYPYKWAKQHPDVCCEILEEFTLPSTMPTRFVTHCGRRYLIQQRLNETINNQKKETILSLHCNGYAKRTEIEGDRFLTDITDLKQAGVVWCGELQACMEFVQLNQSGAEALAEALHIPCSTIEAAINAAGNCSDIGFIEENPEPIFLL